MSQGYPWSVIKGTKFKYNCQETGQVTRGKLQSIKYFTYHNQQITSREKKMMAPQLNDYLILTMYMEGCILERDGYLFNGFHDHFSVLFIFIFQVVHNSVDDL